MAGVSASTGKKVCVVSFRQLLRLLEAAALHPHATQDAITVLRQHVRLGMTNNTAAAAAREHTGAETAEASPVSKQSILLPSLASVANAEAVRCLAYVESGLTTLALEKGAQLLQVGLLLPLLMFLLLQQRLRRLPQRLPNPLVTQCHYWDMSRKDTRFLGYQLAGVSPCWMKLSVFLLLQSVRDFDCTESFLVEAVAAGAAPRVGSAAPRWCFRVLDGPLHPPPNRQKSTWQQLESGSLLILKPVDSVSVGPVAVVVAVVGISVVAGNCAVFIVCCVRRLLGLLCVVS